MDQLQCYLAFTKIIVDPIALADLEGGYPLVYKDKFSLYINCNLLFGSFIYIYIYFFFYQNDRRSHR